MKKLFPLILMFSIALGAYSQDDSGVKMMVSFSGKDTVELRNFDESQNIVFQKIFPQYGISQILCWEYENGVLQSYTWSHSNIGFVETEYEYDSMNNVVNLYSYERNRDLVPKDLMSFNSGNALKNSKEFLAYRNGKRIHKGTRFFQKGLLVKELNYGDDSRVDTVIYTYKDSLLISKRVSGSGFAPPHVLIYEYDSLGNEVRWMKIFRSTDTSVMYTKTYQDGNLLEVRAFEKGQLKSIESCEYTNGKLKSKKQLDANGVEKMSSEYTHRLDGRIDFIDEINKYQGLAKRTYYFY